MPALLAYLVALTILIGGGYGGLHYLSEHNGPELTKSQQAKLAARRKFEREAATRIADQEDEIEEARPSRVAAAAAPDIKPEVAPTPVTEPAVAPKPVAPVRQIVIDTPPEPSASQVPAVVAETAKVEPATPAPAAAPVAAPSVAVATAEPAAPTAEIPPLPMPRPAAAPAVAAAVPAATPPARKPIDSLAAVTAADAPAVTTAAEKPAAAPTPAPKRQARTTPAREKPVLMTLQTIEYADGRIAQRLVPLQQPRRAAGATRMSRAEWFGGEFDD
jgi:hypothetical protein